MITNLMIHYMSPLWLLSTALELGLLVLFLRPLERRRDNLTRSFALLAVLAVLWHGNHLLHFDFAFDFLVNIALVTGFIALVGRTRRGQALYLACVFLLCSEIGKIIAVDVLLTEKRRQCLGAGIRPTFFVDGSRLGFINDFDLCTLIGNAADNAIEATSQLPLGEAREFSLSVTYRNDIAIIHCQNRFRGAIAGNGPLPRTTKGGDAADAHGIGMRSMERTAEKYDGHLTWEADGGTFTLVIMVPVPPSP